ncbi:MAG: UbiA family prenyltransferase [Verrucomicrobiae bacterium]|nr:UbiA family prenyltransferase [Verrucomicrobiae bacterium]
MSWLRSLLILGRVSNLPTVWSNCLAGWWLGGGGNLEKFPFLFIGTTLLYIGGMFLNDAFDATFDQQHRRERPIPSGAIERNTVWKLGFVWLGLGELSLLWLGPVSAATGVALALCILVYNAVHKLFTLSPVLMGACRFLVYVLAASTGVFGITGRALWSGVALGVYVVGLSGLARKESSRGPTPRWPVVLLSAPILLALLMNPADYREPALLVSLVLALWVVRCLRTAFWTTDVNVGRTVSGLLAGIVFVDWLAVAPEISRTSSVGFLLLFLAALLTQRLAPAS